KVDRAAAALRDVLPAIQEVSSRPLVLHEVPIRDGTAVTGYIDLVTEKAYAFRPNAPSDEVALPESVRERERQARTQMLEQLADFDDALLEKLLEDQVPSSDEIAASFARDLVEDRIVPVFLGSAEHDNGVRRLIAYLVALVPEPGVTAARRGVAAEGPPLAQAIKTLTGGQGGKLTVARIWRGRFNDGDVVNGHRIGGIYRLMGAAQIKIDHAEAGDVVALGRLDGVRTGDSIAPGDGAPEPALPRAELAPATFALAIHAQRRDDDVKLSPALAKLIDEDPSLAFEQDAEVNQLVLHGYGDIHLNIAFERLRNRFKLPVESTRPRVAYKEAIRKPVTQHGRFKRQTGGHGMFGDVHVEIKPLPRGSGFEFSEHVVGGSVPRNFIPAVEAGVREYLVKGPLGFQVVDVAVKLFDGSYHQVDSNEMSFKLAARAAMTEGMPKCAPILLEPINHVEISVPASATSKVNQLVNARRGQLLGFEAKAEWPGWDVIVANIPAAEMQDLVLELRSLTQGVGVFASRFDHLAELTGRIADHIVQAHAEATAKAS
ncbi:MAG: elongation factor G, partial [Alphaproteobacteria bacterium]